MSNHAFFLTGDRVAYVANDVGPFSPYRASAYCLPAGEQVAARCHDTVEMQFIVEAGTAEFMIAGATGFVSAGGVVRVPAGVTYGYRNAGDDALRLLTRRVTPQAKRRAIQIKVDVVAA